MALHVLAYDRTRVLNLLGVRPLMANVKDRTDISIMPSEFCVAGESASTGNVVQLRPIIGKGALTTHAGPLHCWEWQLPPKVRQF
jgi:hypothetical protein